jgi:hypothetical protein
MEFAWLRIGGMRRRQSCGTGARAVRSRSMDDAKETEIVAAIVAVTLAGFVTFILWAIFGT